MECTNAHAVLLQLMDRLQDRDHRWLLSPFLNFCRSHRERWQLLPGWLLYHCCSERFSTRNNYSNLKHWTFQISWCAKGSGEVLATGKAGSAVSLVGLSNFISSSSATSEGSTCWDILYVSAVEGVITIMFINSCHNYRMYTAAIWFLRVQEVSLYSHTYSRNWNSALNGWSVPGMVGDAGCREW